MTYGAPKHAPSWLDVAPRDVDGIAPPNDQDAERKALDAMLTVPEFVDRVRPPLEAGHFYSEAHRWIAEAIFAIHDSGVPVDGIAVTEWLSSRNKFGLVGGARACVGPISLTETEQKEAVSAAKVVWELGMERELATHCQQAIAALYSRDAGSYGDFMRSFEAKTEDICRRGVLQTDSTTAREGFERLIRSILKTEERNFFSTGYPSLDAAFGGGLYFGEYTIVGAMSGHGKTTLAMNLALNVAMEGLGVLYVSTEMEAHELIMLAIASLTSVPALSIRSKAMYPAQQTRVIGAAAKFKDLPLRVDDNGGQFGQSVASIKAQARREKRRFERDGKRLALIVVDYFQELQRPKLSRTATDEQALCYMSRELRDLSQKTGAHVIALSQLNDNARNRDDYRPDVGDLKGAKGIRFPAQTVAFLHREKVNGKYLVRGPAEFLIRKARFSSTDPVMLTWDAAISRFEDGSAA